jgi:hypothetical protein
MVLISAGIISGIVLLSITAAYLQVLKPGPTYTIWDISTNDIIYAFLTFILAVSITVLGGLCVLVNDSDYVYEHPIRFGIELAYLFILPIVFEMLVNIMRNRPIFQITLAQYIAAGLKLTIFHLLFQFGGLYKDRDMPKKNIKVDV